MNIDRLESVLDRQIGFVRAAESRLGVLVAAFSFEITLWTYAAATIKIELVWPAVLLFFSAVLLSFCSVEVLRSIVPRTVGAKDSLIFFEFIKKRSLDEYTNEIIGLSDDQYQKDLIEQIWVNAKIASLKFKHTSNAILLLGLSAATLALLYCMFLGVETNVARLSE